MTQVLRSRENPVFRQLRRLVESARQRRLAGMSLIEGIHLCQSYLARYGAPLQLVRTEAATHAPEIAALVQQALQADAKSRRLDGGVEVVLSEGLFAELSQVVSGPGIAFVIETPQSPLPARLDADALYLDGIQDPGNVGTILRSCAAAGVTRVITAPGTAFCWAPKVLRAGMGAHFALDIHEGIDWASLAPRLALRLSAAAPRSELSLWQADLRAPRLWVFGGEGRGLDAQRLPATEAMGGVQWLSIPQQPEVESLNVAAAVAVCLFEQRRQRLLGALSEAAAPAAR